MASNWSELSHHLLTLITDKLILIKDYVRFGATCVNWHSIFLENCHRLPRQLPLLMISVDNDNDNDNDHDHERPTRIFYSLLEKRLYDFQLRVPHNLLCRGSSFGWLLIADEGKGEGEESLKVSLLNPLSSINNDNEIHLPSLNSLEITAPEDDLKYGTDLDKILLSANPSTTSDYVIMLIYGGFSRLGFIKSGDETWSSIEWERRMFHDVIYHQGQFYAVQHQGHIVACDITSSRPKLLQVAPALPEKYWTEKKYLVESSGELLVVRREVDFIGDNNDDDDEDEDEDEDYPLVKTEWTYKTVGFQVFKYDLIESDWVVVKSLCGRMLFLGDNSTMSLLASDFPGCKPNRIYFTDDKTTLHFRNPPTGTHDIGVFNLEDGSFEPNYPIDPSPMFLPPPVWVEPTLQGRCY